MTVLQCVENLVLAVDGILFLTFFFSRRVRRRVIREVIEDAYDIIEEKLRRK